MKTFWLTFIDGTEASCQGESEYDSKLIAEKLTGKKVTATKPLPYPSHGCIWIFDHPVYGKTPEFCFTGKKCAGKTACPSNYSCTE